MNDTINNNPLLFICGFFWIVTVFPTVAGYYLGRYGLPFEIKRKGDRDEQI